MPVVNFMDNPWFVRILKVMVTVLINAQMESMLMSINYVMVRMKNEILICKYRI